LFDDAARNQLFATLTFTCAITLACWVLGRRQRGAITGEAPEKLPETVG
jgi:AAT family amino acid transporter